RRLQRLRDEKVPAPDKGEPRSVVQADPKRAAGNEPLAPAERDQFVDLQRLLALHAKTLVPKANPELAKKEQEEEKQLLEKFKGKPLARPVLVLRLVTEERVTRADLAFLVGLLARAKAPEYAETKLLARLAKLPADEEAGPWPTDAVRLRM